MLHVQNLLQLSPVLLAPLGHRIEDGQQGTAKLGEVVLHFGRQLGVNRFAH